MRICIVILLTVVPFACSKSKETLPKLDNVVVIKVGLNYAIISANISSTGNNDIIEKGFCWSKDPDPTVSDNSLAIPGTGNSFSDTIP
jgi:hypothetical protein